MPKNKETLPEKQARLKALCVLNAKSLYHYRLIADATGIAEKTLHEWKKEDNDFHSELKKSRTHFLERNMRKAPPAFLLERLEYEIFKERKEIEENQTVRFEDLNDEELERAIKARKDRIT